VAVGVLDDLERFGQWAESIDRSTDADARSAA
jgi:hypothetical protein